MRNETAHSPGAPLLWLRWVVGLLATGAFLAVVHNFGFNLWPRERLTLAPERMTIYSPTSAFAYAYPYWASLSDDSINQRSRVELFEDGKPLVPRLRALDEVTLVGGGRWSHVQGQIIFTSTYNSDPRSNGQKYEILVPRFYSLATGRAAVVVFFLSVWMLGWLSRHKSSPPRNPGPVRRWRWHLSGAAFLFLVGLYCNTGTMPPYASTTFPEVNKTTGYLYNPDHIHFKVLYDFVDGADRKVWNNALLLRRILYPVLAWPFMKIGGFEKGGTIASLVFNLAAFLAGGWLLRKQVGERGAVLGVWLLALYPGAAYWGGLPYPYALIFPGSLLVVLGLAELAEARPKKLVWVSLAIGVAYLGYDLVAFFLPATCVLFALKKRWRAGLAAGLLQVTPLAIWLLVLRYGLAQPLSNSNTGVYSTVLHSFQQIRDVKAWWAEVSNFGDLGLDIFFGSNFIFIPALFLAVWALNRVTSRIRFSDVEVAVLVAALVLYLFNNLAPIYGGWNMRGTWIARLYQPIIPVLVLFVARWWQALPALNGGPRLLVYAALGATLLGNALIVFGPITGNPWRVSEYAFYKFYNHTDVHWVYPKSLRDDGRRPLGFPRPQS